MKDTTEAMWIGGWLGFVLTSIIWTILMVFVHEGNDGELSCREGKLFEISHEGNITIYDPTYDDCEVN